MIFQSTCQPPFPLPTSPQQAQGLPSANKGLVLSPLESLMIFRSRSRSRPKWTTFLSENSLFKSGEMSEIATLFMTDHPGAAARLPAPSVTALPSWLTRAAPATLKYFRQFEVCAYHMCIFRLAAAASRLARFGRLREMSEWSRFWAKRSQIFWAKMSKSNHIFNLDSIGWFKSEFKICIWVCCTKIQCNHLPQFCPF